MAFGYGETFSYIFPRPDAVYETPLYGVYSNLGGSLARVLDKGDILDGKLVRRAYLGRDGLDGNQLAISVVFDDMSEALYIVTPIPEPMTLTILLSGLVLVAIAILRGRGLSAFNHSRHESPPGSASQAARFAS